MTTEELEMINSKINEVPKFDRRSFKSLTVNKPYPIRSLAVTETRYGRCVVSQLLDSGEVFQCWLPKRLVDTLTENFINVVNAKPDTYTVSHVGDEHRGSISRALVKFDQIGNSVVADVL